MAAIRLFLLIQGASLILAALVHFGVLASGYEHQPAGTAETVIGCVLLAALALTLLLPAAGRRIGLLAQAFALLGTCVGIFTIIIGVGPQTTADILYHVVLVTLLVAGLVVTWRLQIAD